MPGMLVLFRSPLPLHHPWWIPDCMFLRVRVAHRVRQLKNAVCGCQLLLCGRGRQGGSNWVAKAVSWLRRSVASLSPRRTGLDTGLIRVRFMVDPALKRTSDTDCSWFWSVTLVKCLDSVRIKAIARFFHVVSPIMRHLCHHMSLLTVWRRNYFL